MIADDVAKRIAGRYARRCWWAERDDLEQVARVACVEASRTWDSEVGVPFKAYAWRAASFAVRRYLWRASAPVSASDHKLTELRGKHRAPESSLFDRPNAAPPLDAIVGRARWERRVRERLRLVFQRGMAEKPAAMAASVVLDERRPRDVAAEYSVEVAQVYRARKRATSLVLRDLECYRLWRELYQ